MRHPAGAARLTAGRSPQLEASPVVVGAFFVSDVVPVAGFFFESVGAAPSVEELPGAVDEVDGTEPLPDRESVL